MLNRKKLRELRETKTKATNKLRLAKELAEVTQTVIAERMAIAQSQVCDDMNGKSPDMSRALAKARAYAGLFGCTVDDLFPPEASA
jgi:transcriptional regulator with XRE-family HTH domain